jgi:hypothetical protein
VRPDAAARRRRLQSLRSPVCKSVVVALSVVLAGCGHSGGDPGGKVLGTLKRIRLVVPLGASGVNIQSSDAAWLPACAEIPGSHAGWGDVAVTVRFTDTATSASVIANVDAVLHRGGWIRHDLRTSPSQGLIPHWTLKVPHDSRATAYAYPVPAGSHAWFITASWQPPGPVDEGCP